MRTVVNLELLPTPRSQNGEPRNNKVWARPLDQPQNLENALALLPTPTTSYSQTSAEEWRARRPAGNGQSRKMVGDLRIVIEEELNGDPTVPRKGEE